MVDGYRMQKETSPKERERILLKMVSLILVFLIAGALAANFLLILGLISAEERILVLTAILLPGLLVSGVYASKKFARNYDEFAFGVSLFLTLSAFFGGLLYLAGKGFALSFFSFVSYLFLLCLPVSWVLGLLAFEILLGRKTDRPLLFHVKRFVSRMVLLGFCLLLVLGLFSGMYLLVPFVPDNHLIIVLAIATLVATIVIYVMTRNPKIRAFFSSLEKGEW